MSTVRPVGCDEMQRPFNLRWRLLWLALPLLAACSRKSATDSEAGSSLAPAAVVSTAAVSASNKVPAAPVTVDHERAATDLKKTCETICGHSFALKCTQAKECAINCLGMATLTPCSAEFAGLYSCLVNEPVAHWECGADGVAAIREGYCERQQAVTASCMEKKLKM